MSFKRLNSFLLISLIVIFIELKGSHIFHFCLFEQLLNIHCPFCGVTKSFEEIFKYVNQIISKPVSKGGGKLNQKYGSRGIGVLGCYDISIALIKSIPGCSLPNKIYLIKDSSKGPWNYTTKILNINPIKN